MNTIAIIAEYNPFHSGHHHQLQYLHEHYPESLRIAIMSGSFVQRGTPAFFTKFNRAKWAVMSGADIVFELPTIYSLGSAEIFGTGAVRLGAALGIDALSFGSEVCNIEQLKATSHTLLSHKTQERCQILMKSGLSYNTALRQAVVSLDPTVERLMNSPNALLGLEYIKAIEKHHISMDIIPVQRYTNHHDESLTNDFPSGTALRNYMSSNVNNQTIHSLASYFPPAIFPFVTDALLQGDYMDLHRYYDMVHTVNRLNTATDLHQFHDFTEGIEYRWVEGVSETSWAKCRDFIKTKRYSYSRLDRMSAYSLLGITKEMMTQAHHDGPSYTRLLAFNDRGRQWLKEQRNSNIDIIQKWAPMFHSSTNSKKELLTIDVKATNIQALSFSSEDSRRGNKDFTYCLYYLKS